MLFNVPQYIDVEDKVAGPFTAKQLLWMFGCGAVLLVLWNILGKAVFFVVVFPVILIFLAFAFYRPYNQPLIKLVYFAIFFLFRPKIYVWKRITEPKASRRDKARPAAVIKKKEKKQLSEKEIEELAKMLDSEGKERNEKIMEIINSRKSKAPAKGWFAFGRKSQK